MLRQLLSISDVEKLKSGDQLSDHPEWSSGKIFTVVNVCNGLIYAISEGYLLELKTFKIDALPQAPWWLFTRPASAEELVAT